MKRILLRTVLILALATVFIVGTLTLVRGWSASRLDRYKRDLRAKGEKLLPSELIAGPVVSNTLIPRLAAANRQLGAAPDFELMHSSGQPAWKRTNNWPAMRTLLDAAATPLAQIREALQVQPRDLGWDQTNWNAYPSPDPMIQVRTATFWLSASVIIELNGHRIPEAVTNLLGMLNLVQCHAEERTLVYQMVRVALSAYAFKASWELLQATGWSDPQLAQLQSSWQKLTMLTPLELALQMERARGLQFFELARGGTADGGSLKQPPDSFSGALYAPLWQMALSGSDERLFLHTMGTFLDCLRAAQKNSSGLELERLLASIHKPGWLADFRFPMARVLIPNIQKALKRAVRAEAQRQVVLAAIGLERYRLRHGRYPEKLEELVPQILPTVPVDFGDGKPLRYERKGERYRLWSIWEDVQWVNSEERE